ncbi:MAG: PQQ-like beta-propeller repeat protein [Planctomycetes bacterium]|nr:PQQ-like beta-propeller repeat protein [Planctomycetota bacterium]
MRQLVWLVCILALGCDYETASSPDDDLSGSAKVDSKAAANEADASIQPTKSIDRKPGEKQAGGTVPDDVATGSNDELPIDPQPFDIKPGKKQDTETLPDGFETELSEPKPSTTRTLAERVAAAKVPDLRTRKTGDDWPTFLGPTGDSKSREQGILKDWRVGSPRIVWQMKVGDGYGMPSISRGRLFQFDQRDRDTPTLTCVNSETGKPLWKFTYKNRYVDTLGYENGPRCSPVVDGDRVYLYGVEGMIYCLRVTDGKELWRVDTVADYGVVQNFFGIGSTPVIEGDLLIAMVGGSPPNSPSTYSGRVKGNGAGIVAFNKYTGKEKYKITDELASYSSPVLATIRKRRWCFIFMRGGLVGFEPTTGKVDFQYAWRSPKRESVNVSRPVVVDDRVFISETYGPGSSLLKVHPRGFNVVWKDKADVRERAMQTHWNTPIHHDGYLYGSSGRHSNEAELRCIEWATGKVMWSKPGLTRSSLMMVDGHFVCLSEEGTLRLLRVNPKKYDLVSELVLPGDADDPLAQRRAEFGLPPLGLIRPPAWAATILSHGLLYVRGDDRLVCLELIPAKK